ncbi:MAG: Actin-like protein arp9 (SWI/SNF complex component arp9) [Vezdaea aestivalis]|nr:MAG: Actin-like protein arp9 (SWI/SNF complex component arp9) [Vezdaea aestivalis]
MVSFKEDSVVIIAPGTRTTHAQLGLPDSYTPPQISIPSRMFPTADKDKWEPARIRQKKSVTTNGTTNGLNSNGDTDMPDANAVEEEPVWEEDPTSDEGAVYPINCDQIVHWKAYFALISHVYSLLNPPFNSPMIMVAHPLMDPQDIDKITQFVFNKFQPPAFTIVDSALCGSYAWVQGTSLVVDVAYKETRITPVVDWIVDRSAADRIKNVGGHNVTKALHNRLGEKGWTLDMCEKLKRSPICEILPVGTPYPGSVATKPETKGGAHSEPLVVEDSIEPVAVADQPIEAVSGAPIEPTTIPEAEDGVLDIASLLASGKEKEFIAQQDKQKADKAAEKAGKAAEKADKAAKKAAADAALKAERIPNSKRPTNILTLEERRIVTTDEEAKIPEEKRDATPEPASAVEDKPMPTVDEKAANDKTTSEDAAKRQQDKATRKEERRKNKASASGVVKRDLVVGFERFCGNESHIVEHIAAMIYAAIQSGTNPTKRAELWDNIIILGHGASVRGFKEALLTFLTSRYLLSPSSDTMFTSELPSNLSTPLGTGANTPQPQLPGMPNPSLATGSGVNPLLLAATTASHAGQHPSTAGGGQSSGGGGPWSSSAHPHQTPMSIKHAKTPEYFPEWKEVGMDGSAFLGAQMVARIVFFLDVNPGAKNFMTRAEYNEVGPSLIHECTLIPFIVRFTYDATDLLRLCDLAPAFYSNWKRRCGAGSPSRAAIRLQYFHLDVAEDHTFFIFREIRTSNPMIHMSSELLSNQGAYSMPYSPG